jgi:peptide methionine sulfoxide reductase MsrB
VNQVNAAAAIEDALRIDRERHLKTMFYVKTTRQCGDAGSHTGHVYLGGWLKNPGQYWCDGLA